MRKLTKNDKRLGPFTLGPWSHTLSITLETSGDDEDSDSEYNAVRLIAFGWVIQVTLPCIISPFKQKHIALSWDAETVERMGRNWYYNIYPRIYGFSLSNMGNGYDFLQVFYGARTHDSQTDKTWCKHLPWKQWNCVRHSLYNSDGSHFATEERGKFFDFMRKKESCPASYFGFEDYDGELIVATCIIEEREWHKGEGWFKWLKWFTKPRIRHSLDLAFSEEVGPEKGSWKGGTLGHGIEMLSGETPRKAFERYCAKDHERKGRSFKLRFIGPCDRPKATAICATAGNSTSEST